MFSRKAINFLVESITEIIQGVAVGAGILGLSIWGLGKVTRPVFPQIAQMAGNYISDQNPRIRVWDRSILQMLVNKHLDILKPHFIEYEAAISDHQEYYNRVSIELDRDHVMNFEAEQLRCRCFSHSNFQVLALSKDGRL